MKKTVCVLLTIIFSLSFALNISAATENNRHGNLKYGKHRLYCDGIHYLCDCSFYESLLDITNGIGTEQDRDNISGEPEGTGKVLSAEQVRLFQDKRLAFSYGYSLEKLSNIGGTDLCVEYEIYTVDKYVYSGAVSVIEIPLITAEAIMKMLDIPDDTEITAIRLFEHIHLSESVGKTPQYWGASIDDYVTGVSFIDLSKSGWQEINTESFTDFIGNGVKMDREKFYVKSNGTVISKSCRINGIRYKFSRDGVCHGKYTGWTKSAKGKRYYKNGIMLTNKWIKTKSGIRYYVGNDGYVIAER